MRYLLLFMLVFCGSMYAASVALENDTGTVLDYVAFAPQGEPLVNKVSPGGLQPGSKIYSVSMPTVTGVWTFAVQPPSEPVSEIQIDITDDMLTTGNLTALASEVLSPDSREWHGVAYGQFHFTPHDVEWTKTFDYVGISTDLTGDLPPNQLTVPAPPQTSQHDRIEYRFGVETPANPLGPIALTDVPDGVVTWYRVVIGYDGALYETHILAELSSLHLSYNIAQWSVLLDFNGAVWSELDAGGSAVLSAQSVDDSGCASRTTRSGALALAVTLLLYVWLWAVRFRKRGDGDDRAVGREQAS